MWISKWALQTLLYFCATLGWPDKNETVDIVVALREDYLQKEGKDLLLGYGYVGLEVTNLSKPK